MRFFLEGAKDRGAEILAGGFFLDAAEIFWERRVFYR